jgi:hypothetical protein
MALRDPVAVYTAANHMEASLLCDILREQGIDACVTEDVLESGSWGIGPAPDRQEPQVWTERDVVAKVKPILEDYQKRAAATQDSAGVDTSPLQAVCEECGKTSSFAARLKGSVDTCPHCGAYIDVGSVEFAPEDLGPARDEGEPK